MADSWRGKSFTDFRQMPMLQQDFEYCVDKIADLEITMSPLKREKKVLNDNIKSKHMEKEVTCFYQYDKDSGYKTLYALQPTTGEVIQCCRELMTESDLQTEFNFEDGIREVKREGQL